MSQDERGPQPPQQPLQQPLQQQPLQQPLPQQYGLDPVPPRPSFDPPRVSHFLFQGSPLPLHGPLMTMPGSAGDAPLQQGFGEYYPAPLQAQASHQGPLNPRARVFQGSTDATSERRSVSNFGPSAPDPIPEEIVAESGANVRSEESKSFKERKDEDEESDRPISTSDHLASKDAEDGLQTEKTSVKEPVAEDIGIPITPRRQMISIAPPLDNPFASPDLKPIKAFGEALDKSMAGSPIPSLVITPPPTQLREQNLNGIIQGVEKQGTTWAAYQNTLESGTKGCELHQIQTVLESRFKNNQAFQNMVIENPSLISTDAKLFQALRDVYLGKMCSFWRRAFFLKTLRGIRLLSFTPTSRPIIVPLDDFVLQEVLYAYQNPSNITTEHEWIDWVFRLRQPDRRHALEFIEGWNGTRIAVAGSIPLLLSTVLGIVWSVKGSGIQDAFSVAGFILTAGSLLLALLAIISGIESSGQSTT